MTDDYRVSAAKVKLPSAKSEGVETLKLHLKASGINYTQEHKFHCARKWRFDFMLKHGIAVEIEGAIWTAGRHSRGAGMEADMEKYNAAAILGWRVLRFSTGMVKSGVAIQTIREAVK